VVSRHLVVNADDLGLTIGVNDGIFDAHDSGILTSASLIANAPATADAIRRVRTHPSLGIGVHLTLVDGEPVLPPGDVPTLIADDGRFRRSWKPFIAACLERRVSLVEVERELTAQIERLRGAGIEPTHLDSHKHVHAYPPVFAIVARLAARFGIPAVRVPYEGRMGLVGLVGLVGRIGQVGRMGSDLAGPPALPAPPAPRVFVQALLNAATWPWARRNYRTAALLGLRTPQFVGRTQTGVIDRAALHAMLRGTAAGVTELMVHPGYVDEALTRMNTRLLESREQELALLCSTETRAVVAVERIDLVRHDLTRAVAANSRRESTRRAEGEAWQAAGVGPRRQEEKRSTRHVS
jgi:predicted glycoside hydrolase/deacetylase ChbG (UPF0249 family)